MLTFDPQFEHIFIGEDVPATTEYTVFRIILDRAVKARLELIKIGLCEHLVLLLDAVTLLQRVG